jgi:hypothetical protein
MGVTGGVGFQFVAVLKLRGDTADFLTGKVGGGR